MKKHLSVICLLFSLLCVLPLNAYAAESKDTTLKYDVGSSYILTIPDYIEANTDGQAVRISNAVIPADYEIDVTAEFDGLLKLQNHPNITLSYTLFSDKNEVADGESVLKTHSGETTDSSAVISAQVTGAPIYAGTYFATVTFTADLEEVTQTNYTVEEIENDPHLFGIGLTKPQYVVARFNDDYSSAVITKNGDESDGKMIGWRKPISPFSENKETLATVSVKQGVTAIGATAFMNCINLTEVNLPDSIELIGVDAFFKCKALQNIYLSENIEIIGSSAFSNCSSLTEVRLPSKLKKVNSHTFSGCSNLMHVLLGDNIQAIETCAFSSCSSLKGIQLPDSLSEIESWAFRYSGLERIDLPESVTKIGTLAFADCKNLTEVNLPSGITELSDYLFMNSPKLSHIDIPNGVKKIGSSVFSGCRSITTLYIPNNVTEFATTAFGGLTSLTEFSVSESHPLLCVMDGILYSKDKTRLICFPNAKNISSYSVPESITKINAVCFGPCKYLKNLYVGTHVTEVSESTFENAFKPFIHTPTGSAMEQLYIEKGYEYDNIMQ